MMTSTQVASNTATQEASLYLQYVTATITNCQLTNNMGVNGSGLRYNAEN